MKKYAIKGRKQAMKFLHLSDLHLGKRVHNFSMIDDQKYILEEILKIADEEKVTGVIIAGDVYDKPVPSAESVALFDDFLVRLAKRNLQVFVISGNHDSPERIAFGERLMRHSNVFLSPVYRGDIEPIILEDEYGSVFVYMLPFIKPVHVKHFLEETQIDDYTEAMQSVISHMNIDTRERNILVAHQFVTGAVKSESEEISVGGLDNVDASVFAPFDYVALGHIHRAQKIGKETIRYCGTPLKYSFAEAEHKKSVTLFELSEKGEVKICTKELKPMRDMIKIQGFFGELISSDFYEKIDKDSYVQITLFDENDVPNAFGRLAVIYPNLMQLKYDNKRTRESGEIVDSAESLSLSPENLFAQFYEEMNQQPLTKEQAEYMQDKIEEIWGNKV